MFEKKSLTQFIVVLKCVKKLNPRLYVRKINCNLPTHVKFTCNYTYLYVTLFGTSWKRLNLHFSFSRSILFFDFITYNLLGSRTIAPEENCPRTIAPLPPRKMPPPAPGQLSPHHEVSLVNNRPHSNKLPSKSTTSKLGKTMHYRRIP